MFWNRLKDVQQALRGRVGWIVRILLTVGLFYVMFRYLVDPQKLLQALSGIAAGWLVVATAVKGVGVLAAIVRWGVLLRAQGIRVPFSHLAGSFLVGRFIGMFLPSTIGLDGYRAYDIARHAQDAIASVAVILIEKITGFFTLSLLILLTLPAGRRFLPDQLLILVGLLFCLPVALAFILLLRPGLFERVLRWNFPGKSRIEARLREAVTAITAYREQRGDLWLAVLLGLVVHGATALMYYCTAQAVRVGASLPDMLFVGPLIIVATLIGPVVAGLAAREFTAVWLLQQVQIGQEQGLLVGHLGFWSAEAVPAVIGGLLLALRPASYRPAIEHARRPASPEAPVIESIGPRERHSLSFWRGALLPAVSAGALAGLLVGVAEVVVLAIAGRSSVYLGALPYAALLYGLLGALVGLGLGTALFLLRRTFRPTDLDLTASRWAVALVLAGMIAAVARYRLVRDVFKERLRTFSLHGILVHAGLLVGALVLVVAILFLARRIARARPGRFLARGGNLLLVFLLAGGCLLTSLLVRPGSPAAAQGSVPEAWSSGPNIVLIGVDTLRADYLSCYGHPGLTSPSIDALAADGVLFRHMTSQSSWTKPSFATVFTSLYASSHTAIHKDSRLPQAAITLAEVLQQSGYATGGFADNVNIAPVFGFDQGFYQYVFLEPDYPLGASAASSELALYQLLRQYYARIIGERVVVEQFYQDADTVTASALGWLEAHRDTPFFLFLHYMDPHDPYMEHPYSGRGYARASDANPDPALLETFVQLYGGEVRYLDEHLGRLFDWLKQAGLYDNALIILTADHGEEFQEHGGWWHGETLYEEQIRVPLVIKYPAGVRAGTVEEGPARSLDIAPTILDVAGLEIPQTWQGRSLWGSTEPPAYLFAEEEFQGNVVRSVQQGNLKLILANRGNPRGLPAVALFDLSQDPDEGFNRAQSDVAWVNTLREVLQMAQVEALSQRLEAEEGFLDAAAEEQLRRLGY